MGFIKRFKKAFRIIQNFNVPSNYNEQLEDERWQDKRKEILAKHDYTCDWCGTHNYLQVHHKYYNKYPNKLRVPAWNYPDDCFMCLCDNCHKKYHQKYKVKTYYRRY